MTRTLPQSKAAAVVNAVSTLHNVSPADVLSPARYDYMVRARQHAMWMLREQGYSYSQIGRALGRDHTTVVFGVRAHAKRQGERA